MHWEVRGVRGILRTVQNIGILGKERPFEMIVPTDICRTK
jgi:hypothetical protein